MKIIVVGAGVIGCSVAYHAAKAGAAVTLVEGNHVGCGASSASFAWTNSNGKPPRSYHDLNVMGLEAYKALAAELGEEPWMHRSGSIEWRTGSEAEALAGRLAELRDLGYPSREIDVREAMALEPDLNPEALRDAMIVLSPEEGWIDPVVYCGRLVHHAARNHGLTVHAGTPVVSLTRTGGRVSGVGCADGRSLEADLVVTCVGTATNALLQASGYDLPLVRNIGFLAFSRPAPVVLSRPLHGPDVDIRPDGGGRLMLRRDSIDELSRDAIDLSPAGPTAGAVLDRAREVLRHLQGVEIEAVRITERPIPGDGLSAIGPVEEHPGLYVAVTHSGVTLSPIVGRLVAKEAVLGASCPELADFRPGRFRRPETELKRYKGGM